MKIVAEREGVIKMLSKKINVQKSFRIEANMERDLELLSQKLNRPQNELVNAALNQLMLDNMEWFAEDFLIDLCADFFEKKVSELSIEIMGLRLRLQDNGKNIVFDYKIELSNFTENCSSGCLGNTDIGYGIVEKILKDIAVIIGHESREIQEYLHNRFNYIYARESVIQKFDRRDFIMRSVGISPSDPEYKQFIPQNNDTNCETMASKKGE